MLSYDLWLWLVTWYVTYFVIVYNNYDIVLIFNPKNKKKIEKK